MPTESVFVCLQTLYLYAYTDSLCVGLQTLYLYAYICMPTDSVFVCLQTLHVYAYICVDLLRQGITQVNISIKKSKTLSCRPYTI